jgi:hypothetical protein
MRFHVAVVGPSLTGAEDAITKAGVGEVESVHLQREDPAVLIVSVDAEDGIEAEHAVQQVLPPGHAVGPARPAAIQDP